jgi:N6-adenosine-specific RNA methylase IME4
MSASPKADNLPLPPLPEERFGLISIDPPWHFRSRAPSQNPDSDRSPQAHYPTMDLEHIAAIPMKQIAATDCYVMLWITGPLMVAGVHNMLFKRWGCRPSSTAFVWIKLWNNFDMNQMLRTPLLEADLAMGTGFTTRQNAEFVMLARFGSPKILRRDIRQVIISPRREHSRKPEEFYRRAELFCAGPRIDMFAGAERPGWTSYGWSHREGERPDDSVQKTGRRARCNTCGKPAQVNEADVCASCMEAAAL